MEKQILKNKCYEIFSKLNINDTRNILDEFKLSIDKEHLEEKEHNIITNE